MNKLAKTTLVFFFLTLAFGLLGQDRVEFLTQNRTDLRKDHTQLIKEDFSILGFGALHGSAKTYEAELSLVRSLLEEGRLDVYIIESNFSQAFFFQEYLESGDEQLLEELTYAFQTMVYQEGSVETFNYWKDLRALLQSHPEWSIKVIGCDIVNENRFPIKHLVQLTQREANWESLEALEKEINKPGSDATIWNSKLNEKMGIFLEDYKENRDRYVPFIKDVWTFDHIVKSISFNYAPSRDREKIIFDNYQILKEKFDLGSKKQFVKYGYYHIQKFKEGERPSFFTRLIENEVYNRNEVITVMGYLTKSKVLWDKKFDKKGEYKGYTTKTGFGISDYWKEYFKGIDNLKEAKLSDLTLFALNREGSPYTQDSDLVEVKMFLKDHNTTKLVGKNTLQFIDYALMISDSKEQIPIEERKVNLN